MFFLLNPGAFPFQVLNRHPAILEDGALSSSSSRLVMLMKGKLRDLEEVELLQHKDELKKYYWASVEHGCVASLPTSPLHIFLFVVSVLLTILKAQHPCRLVCRFPTHNVFGGLYDDLALQQTV